MLHNSNCKTAKLNCDEHSILVKKKKVQILTNIVNRMRRNTIFDETSETSAEDSMLTS